MVMDSLLNQTVLPDEVIIADDGSGEDTTQMVRRFSKTYPFPVLYVWHEDRGFRAAKIRNEAIIHSSGDYIILLDGDCVVNRHFISDHILLSETGCFIQGKRMLVKKNSVLMFSHRQANSFLSLIILSLRGELSNIHHLFHLRLYPAIKSTQLKNIKSCNMSFFKSDIVAVNGFNEDFVGWGNEDSELVCRLFKYGLIKKVHQFMAVCFHLWHPTNKSHNDNKELLLATIASKEHFCKNGLVKKN